MSLAEKLSSWKRSIKKEREVGEWFGRVGVVRRSRHDARIGGRDEDGETFHWMERWRKDYGALRSQRDEYKEKANAVFMSDEDVAKADALIHKKQREEKENRKRRFFGGFRHNKRKDMDAALDEDTKTNFETIVGGISDVQSDAETLLAKTEDEKDLWFTCAEKQEAY